MYNTAPFIFFIAEALLIGGHAHPRPSDPGGAPAAGWSIDGDGVSRWGEWHLAGTGGGAMRVKGISTHATALISFTCSSRSHRFEGLDKLGRLRVYPTATTAVIIILQVFMVLENRFALLVKVFGIRCSCIYRYYLRCRHLQLYAQVVSPETTRTLRRLPSLGATEKKWDTIQTGQ